MIQFSIIRHFSSIWPINRILSGATMPGQSGPGSSGNKGVLCISQFSSITGDSWSDCLVSYPGLLLGESYLSEEMQLVYSAAPANWTKWWGLGKPYIIRLINLTIEFDHRFTGNEFI